MHFLQIIHKTLHQFVQKHNAPTTPAAHPTPPHTRRSGAQTARTTSHHIQLQPQRAPLPTLPSSTVPPRSANTPPPPRLLIVTSAETDSSTAARRKNERKTYPKAAKGSNIQHPTVESSILPLPHRPKLDAEQPSITQTQPAPTPTLPAPEDTNSSTNSSATRAEAALPAPPSVPVDEPPSTATRDEPASTPTLPVPVDERPSATRDETAFSPLLRPHPLACCHLPRATSRPLRRFHLRLLLHPTASRPPPRATIRSLYCLYLHSKSHNRTLHKRRKPLLLFVCTFIPHAPPRVATHFSHTRAPPRSPAHHAIPQGGTPRPLMPAPSQPPAVTSVVPPLLIPAWPLPC